MADTFALVIDGLNDLRDLEKLPQDMIRSARIAVNDAATRSRTRMGREVLSQINFPDSYVSPRNKRLYVSKPATSDDLEAIISARARPTSLARFAVPSQRKSEGGVRVELKKGVVRQIPGKGASEGGYHAFLMSLNAGPESIDTKNNKGLALRVPAGKKPDKAYRPLLIAKDLYLLYGPSVSQMLLPARNSRNGIAEELSPDILDMLEAEFRRQMDL